MKSVTITITANKSVRPHVTILNRFLLAALILLVLAIPGQAEPIDMNANQITLERLKPDANKGYGYRLIYYLPGPLDAVWKFKTEFDSELMLTNEELIGHRILDSTENHVVSENRYAAAPGLRFKWRTTMLPDQHRLEFKLLNPEDCRHDFHYGWIQLMPAGGYTKVTQTAYFDFRGASIWVKYPWYGGMRSTMTKLAQWEQKAASRYHSILASSKN